MDNNLCNGKPECGLEVKYMKAWRWQQMNADGYQ